MDGEEIDNKKVRKNTWELVFFTVIIFFFIPIYPYFHLNLFALL